MIIKFKLDDYYETCDEYERVFELDDTVDVVDEENCLIVSAKRIVAPELHASFRTAEWYARNEDVEDEVMKMLGRFNLLYLSIIRKMKKILKNTFPFQRVSWRIMRASFTKKRLIMKL